MEGIKIEQLTEELKSKVRNYFETGNMGGLSENYIWLTYGRMRYYGTRIDKAERYLEEKRIEKLLQSSEYEDENGGKAF